MSIFESELYPTPTPVIEKMLAPFCEEFEYRPGLTRKIFRFTGTICEPHGGTGAILDYLTDVVNLQRKSIVTMEIDPELRYLLQGKNYKVIGSDFLEYDEPTRFGMILANPPFSNGVLHALKIWQLLADDGHAAILLNHETIFNPCTKDRRVLLSILASHINYPLPTDFIDQPLPDPDLVRSLTHDLTQNGWLECLGACFQDSDRPTNVEVVLIRFHKPPKESVIDFDGLDVEREAAVSEQEFAANPLAHPNIIKSLVSQYNAAISALLERDQSQAKLNFYLQGIENPVIDSEGDKTDKALFQSKTLDEQVAAIKSRFWNTVFVRTKLSERTTSHFHQKFREFSQNQSNMAFTEANIREVLGLFFENQDAIMRECLDDVFDRLSAFHEDNKIYREGWKTNKSWRINKKVIHPYGVRCDEWGFSQNYSWRSDIYQDLDKCLCYLSARSIEKIRTIDAAMSDFISRIRHDGQNYREAFESTFFKIKIFKKGTVHLVFKDLTLLEQFNRTVAEGRNWIGDGT